MCVCVSVCVQLGVQQIFKRWAKWGRLQGSHCAYTSFGDFLSSGRLFLNHGLFLNLPRPAHLDGLISGAISGQLNSESFNFHKSPLVKLAQTSLNPFLVMIHLKFTYHPWSNWRFKLLNANLTKSLILD